MNLFKIGTTDFSNYILNGTYDINKEEICDVWEDANRVKHSNVVRTNINGQFDVLMRTSAAFDSLKSTLQSNKDIEGYNTITVTPNNTNVAESIRCKVTARPIMSQKANLAREYAAYTVTIEER